MFQNKQNCIPLYALFAYAGLIFLPSFAQTADLVVIYPPISIDPGLSFFFLTLLGSIVLVFFTSREKNRDISESKELEKRRRIINNMNDAVYLFKVHSGGIPGNFEEVNQVTVNRTGYSEEELKEMTVADIAADDLKNSTQIRVKQIFDEEQLTFEWAHKTKDNRILPVEISAQVMHFGDGPYILAVARNISQRKENELKLEHLNRILRAIRNVNRTIPDETSIRSLLHQTCRELTRTDAYTSSWIALLDDNHNLLEFTESELGKTGQEIKNHLANGTLPNCTLQVTDTHEPRVIERSMNDCEECPLKSIDPHGQIIAGPLEYKGNLFGILTVSVPISVPAGERELSLFKELSRDIAFAIHDIRIKQQSEKLLEQYKELFENSINAIAIHEIVTDQGGMPIDYTFLDVNPAFEKITGFTRDFILGKRATELLSGITETHLIETFGKVALGGEPVQFRQEMPGIEKTFHIRAFSHHPGKFVTTFKDVTQQASIQKALEESEVRFQQVWNSSPMGMSLFDESGVVVMVNPAYCDLLELSEEDLVGSVYGTNIKQAAEDIPIEKFQALFNQEESFQNFEMEVNLPSGNVKHLSITTTPISYHDGRDLLLSIVQDISQQKTIEQDMRRRQRLEALGQIAGGIAHDFNNVLAAINGATQMLELLSDDPQTKKYVDMISSNVKRGTGITGRILTFAREKELTLEPLILQEFLEEIIDIASHTFPKTINISYKRKPEPILIRSDPAQLQQAILTILINAADAMNHKGVIQIDTFYPTDETQVKQTEQKNQQFICIAISDSGVGMDLETQQRIFEPFFTTKGDAKGTGIGLAVTKKIIDLHSGWIDVESEPEVGTTLTMGLPLAEKQTVVYTEKSIKNLGTEDHQSVLIIEDEKEIQSLLANSLKDLGYTVFTADNATEALKKFELYREDIDIIVTDIGLPDINGSVMIEQIREASDNIPIITTTGYINQDLRRHLLEIGVAQIIYKPYELSDVAAAIQSILQPS